SSGIGLLVTLLVRANRQEQKLFAYGLSDHYRDIFSLTRLSEAIHIYGSEGEALAAAYEAESRRFTEWWEASWTGGRTRRQGDRRPLSLRHRGMPRIGQSR